MELRQYSSLQTVEDEKEAFLGENRDSSKGKRNRKR